MTNRPRRPSLLTALSPMQQALRLAENSRLSPLYPIVSDGKLSQFVDLTKYPKKEIPGRPGLYTAPLAVDTLVELDVLLGQSSSEAKKLPRIHSLIVQLDHDLFEIKDENVQRTIYDFGATPWVWPATFSAAVNGRIHVKNETYWMSWVVDGSLDLAENRQVMVKPRGGGSSPVPPEQPSFPLAPVFTLPHGRVIGYTLGIWEESVSLTSRMDSHET